MKDSFNSICTLFKSNTLEFIVNICNINVMVFLVHIAKINPALICFAINYLLEMQGQTRLFSRVLILDLICIFDKYRPT